MYEFYFSLLSNCCYKFLENDSISLNKFKTQREKCFQILGLLIKNYNHGFSSTIRLIEVYIYNLQSVCEYN